MSAEPMTCGASVFPTGDNQIGRCVLPLDHGGECVAELPPTLCSVCQMPAHASETDDEDRCSTCRPKKSRFRIYSTVSGHVFGDYEAASEADALDVMARDAGYRDHAHASVDSHDDGMHLKIEMVDDEN
jgi:hypothetical protein